MPAADRVVEDILERVPCGLTQKAIDKMLVMPGLVPGIHVFLSIRAKDVDGRGKPGHDGR
jgi:hypothetical protein